MNFVTVHNTTIINEGLFIIYDTYARFFSPTVDFIRHFNNKIDSLRNMIER